MTHSPQQTQPHLLRDAGLLFIILLLAGIWNLEGPEFWWDEGWTLSVAGNVVTRDHYGRLLEGAPADAGLAASPVVTLPTAALMRLLGVGLWQGRLFNVICAAAALSLMFMLAARLYDRRVAWGTIAVALLLAALPQLNPLLLGRQALGEMPMLCYLVGGFVCLSSALRGRALWIIPAALLWSLAILAKAQTLPFWAVSIAGALAAALLIRQWRAAALLGIGGGVAYFGQPWVLQVVMLPVIGRIQPGAALDGLYEVTAFVPQSFNRLYALQILLLGGLPALMGLGYAAWRVLAEWRAAARQTLDDHQFVLRAALLSLAGSWMAWFALLSVGVPRYLFPAVFCASMFTAALLRDLTGDFRPRDLLARLVAPLRERRFTRAAAGAWFAALLLAIALPLALLSYQRYYFVTDQAAFRVAAYLNSATSPDALIETYESELHFLLNRRYHYPPDQVHVELNRRSLLSQDTPIAYDPLAANPDYLVVGRFAAGNDLYAAAIASGQFREIMRDERYRVYQRVR